MTNAKLSHLSKCDFTGLPLLKTAFKCQFVVLVNCWTYLTCNSAANFAPARTDAGAVPNHPILWSLICFTNLVCPQIVLIITGFLHCKQKQWKVWILFGFLFFVFSPSWGCSSICADFRREKKEDMARFWIVSRWPSGLVLHLMPPAPLQVHSSVLPR